MQDSTLKQKIKRGTLILALLLMCLALPLTMVYISFQSTDESVLIEEEPLNKKQGLPNKPKKDETH